VVAAPGRATQMPESAEETREPVHVGGGDCHTACHEGVAQQGAGKDEADKDAGDGAEGRAKEVGE